jgi:hypothetical protein
MLKEVLGCSIDLTKIDKTKIKEVPCKDGHTGKFIDISILINDEPDQYNNICSVALGQTKEEREAKVNKVYLGYGKRIYASTAQASMKPESTPLSEMPKDDLPF